MSKINSY